MAVAAGTRMTATPPLWDSALERPRYPRLEEDNRFVDVAIVGGGITGITAATLLKAAGKRVAVLEARRIASGVTSGTTAHLTAALDTRYHELESKFGKEGARLAAESSTEAIELVAALANTLPGRADFDWLPGYLYTETDSDVPGLKKELEAARRAGLTVEHAEVPLPIVTKGGIRFERQAQFHPLSYVSALAAALPGAGSHVYEQSRVIAIDEGEPCKLYLEHGVMLNAERVILATHAPLNRVMLETKIAQYRSYVVSGPVEQAPHGLFWDTADPYHYTRAHRVDGKTHLIIGGEDHKTGKADDEREPFAAIEHYAARLGLRSVERRWSAQVVEPVDGLPFIGKNAFSERVYVATGFSGNGTTFGTLAAQILADACFDKPNRFADLYAATRIKPLASLATFLGENVDFPMHVLSDRLHPPEVKSTDDIAPGQGKTVRLNGERLAVYRDVTGKLSACSAVCTHLGCHVRFNQAEKTWDCPCHGSRFSTDGEVLDGPAVRGLPRRHL
jgi:glycine/D-amino acid oxidase-like deaminating enzyme/nitrite reductase/ring-hydroxylating ferredoxin subunit